MNRTLITVVLTLAAVLAVALAGGALFVSRGLYDVGATTQHTQPVFTMLETTLRRSVRLRAADIRVPPLSDPDVVARGAACYRDHCVQCHGGPGVAQEPIGLSMQPLPGPLVDAARRWHPREIYWITRHGIRMTGMPAWGLRLSDADVWATVAFVVALPALSPDDYAQRIDAVRATHCALSTAGAPFPGRPAGAPDDATAFVLYQYACVSCHEIPGLTGSATRVGPPLEGLARRTLIAGRLPNTPENLVRWIRAPQAVKPGTAMPDLGVGDAHARAIAAYLATLR